MTRDPDIDHQPTPPDDDEKTPERIPPDQPGRREREEGEPDPPPIGDPPNNEPIRVLAGRTNKPDRLGSFAPTRRLPSRFVFRSC